jgi:hypothetical protein
MRSTRQGPTLDGPAVYEVRVPGELDERWTDWDGKMPVTVECGGEDPPVTTLTGILDQAGLHGLLRQLYALGLPLISAICVEYGPEE